MRPFGHLILPFYSFFLQTLLYTILILALWFYFRFILCVRVFYLSV